MARLIRIFGFAALALAVPSSAQTYTEIIREGDPLPGGTGEIITRIDNVDINSSGDWLVQVDTDAAVTDDFVVLRNGVIAWREGSSIGFTPPVGKEASYFIDAVDINDAGDFMFISPVRDVGSNFTDGYVLVRNGVTLIETDVTPCNAPGLPMGAIYTRIFEAWQNNNGQILVGGRVDIGGGVEKNILLRIEVDAMGNIVGELKLAIQGETLPGPNHVTPIEGFSFFKGRQAINDNGECIWYVDDDHTVAPGSTLSDENLYITDAAGVNALLYNEADPFPTDLAEVFDHFSTVEVDLNNSGDFVFSGFDRGPATDDSWIFKSIGGVVETIAREGDPVPASVPGTWSVSGVGFGGVVPISNRGDVLWYLDWDDPDTTIDSGLMLNDQMLLQEGVSMLSGFALESIPNEETEIAMSDDGSFVILEVVLDGPINDLDAVYILQLGFGTAYCTTAANSTGVSGELFATGSISIADNGLVLNASNLPNLAFGYVIVSRTQGFAMNPGGSAGNLCVTGSVGRAVGGVIANTGLSGSFSVTANLMAMPQPLGPVVVASGETWNFQAWHRDAVGGTPTSNFTNGLEITFL
ncbi:hypothetical protein Poly30_35310 [Planctomycetes bacterium Poly30]|uniref:Uncharacterized protein n=1 Tax=Saltatorellus ferox TaxID=2528018 RepID=A0A518EV74_9BACT|nr:hypothetical protein Poly30_35310 [Planctomycetes bacterium Poly30]